MLEIPHLVVTLFMLFLQISLLSPEWFAVISRKGRRKLYDLPTCVTQQADICWKVDVCFDYERIGTAM